MLRSAYSRFCTHSVSVPDRGWRRYPRRSRFVPENSLKRWKSSSTTVGDNPEATGSEGASENFPGKSRPREPSPEECCGTGCSDCTYLRYAEDLVEFYKDGGSVALKEVDKIADPSVRAFVKTEIKYYLALDQDVRDIIKASRQEADRSKTQKPQD